MKMQGMSNKAKLLKSTKIARVGSSRLGCATARQAAQPARLPAGHGSDSGRRPRGGDGAQRWGGALHVCSGDGRQRGEGVRRRWGSRRSAKGKLRQEQPAARGPHATSLLTAGFPPFGNQALRSLRHESQTWCLSWIRFVAEESHQTVILVHAGAIFTASKDPRVGLETLLLPIRPGVPGEDHQRPAPRSYDDVSFPAFRDVGGCPIHRNLEPDLVQIPVLESECRTSLWIQNFILHCTTPPPQSECAPSPAVRRGGGRARPPQAGRVQKEEAGEEEAGEEEAGEEEAGEEEAGEEEAGEEEAGKEEAGEEEVGEEEAGGETRAVSRKVYMEN
eukprot:gene3396-biopygen11676